MTTPRRRAEAYFDDHVPDRYVSSWQFPLPEPTDAMPGTAAKIAVLAERVRRGQQLWSPLDAGCSTHDDDLDIALRMCGRGG